MCLGGGRTPRKVICVTVSERENTRFIPDFPSCRCRGQNRDCLLLFFVKRLLNIGRKLDSKNRVSIPPWQTCSESPTCRLDRPFRTNLTAHRLGAYRRWAVLSRRPRLGRGLPGYRKEAQSRKLRAG